MGADEPTLTADEIVRRIDENMWITTASYDATLTITSSDRVDEKRMVVFAQGRAKAFSEVLYPPKEEGTKHLRIDDQMWIYMPSIEKVIRISGHMLRQSMLGSDFSYEDALDRSKRLIELYEPVLLGTDVIDSVEYYVLELNAREKDVTYRKRKAWVDKQMFLPVREEYYSSSGKLLKEMVVGKIESYDDRYYPTDIVMNDLVRKGSSTRMQLSNVEFDVDVPSRVFTRRNLKR
jgi:outer membrane lipoprotein-sorting protein